MILTENDHDQMTTDSGSGAKVRGCDILNSERRCMPGFPMLRSVLRLAVSP